jgi:hypothetical protein
VTTQNRLGILSFKTSDLSRVLVAHACNPSYSGGRDQEDGGLKPAQANSLQDPISKIPITKRAGGVAQGEGPEFKPQYHKKKKKFRFRPCYWWPVTHSCNLSYLGG